MLILSRMPRKRLARQVLLATPTKKQPSGCPRTKWSDYISDCAWSHLGVDPAEPSEIAAGDDLSCVLIGLLEKLYSRWATDPLLIISIGPHA